MLLVLPPETSVNGAICVRINAEAISLLIAPVALIHVAICMDQSAVSGHLIIEHVALVHAAILPDDHAWSVSLRGLARILRHEPGALVALPCIQFHHGLGQDRAISEMLQFKLHVLEI